MSVAQLRTGLDALDLEIATVIAERKPSYSVDGRSMDWNGYRDHLLKHRAELKQLIINESGAVEAVGHVLG